MQSRLVLLNLTILPNLMESQLSSCTRGVGELKLTKVGCSRAKLRHRRLPFCRQLQTRVRPNSERTRNLPRCDPPVEDTRSGRVVFDGLAPTPSVRRGRDPELPRSARGRGKKRLQAAAYPASCTLRTRRGRGWPALRQAVEVTERRVVPGASSQRFSAANVHALARCGRMCGQERTPTPLCDATRRVLARRYIEILKIYFVFVFAPYITVV